MARSPSPYPQVFDRGSAIPQTEQVFDSCVLGVDPGVSALGLAAVARQDRKPVLLFADTVRTRSGLPDAARLRLLHDAVAQAIATHRPASVAIERIAWNKNQVSAMIVARATGVILLAAAEAGLEVEEYGSLEVKMAVTGQGDADKAQVRVALERFHGLEGLQTTGCGRRSRDRAVSPHTGATAQGRGAVISFLEGDVAERSGARVVISVGGVGYDVQVAASTLAKLPPVGRPTRIYTRMVVRDDAMMLFGFANADERELFDLLVTVSGIGPRVALSFLSVLSPDAFRRAVSSGDVAALTVVPGVGKKVAQRVVLDLKDKLGAEDVVIVDGPLADVREALLALGLSQQETSDAMRGLTSSRDSSVEELLRQALQHIGRG